MNTFWFPDPENPSRFRVNNFLAGFTEDECEDLDDLLEYGAILLKGLHGRLLIVVLDQIFVTLEEAYIYMQKHEAKSKKMRLNQNSYVSLQFNDE